MLKTSNRWHTDAACRTVAYLKAMLLNLGYRLAACESHDSLPLENLFSHGSPAVPALRIAQFRLTWLQHREPSFLVHRFALGLC